VQTGKLDFASLVDAMLADLTRLSIRMAVLGPIAQALGGAGSWAGSLFSSSGGETAAPAYEMSASGPWTILHAGGIVGTDPTPLRQAPLDLLASAPRYHAGGLAGDEVPAILKRGEGVFTAAQMAALGGRKAAVPNVTINIINNAGAQVSTERREDAGGLSIDVLIDAVETAMASRAARPGTRLNRALATAANPIRAR